MSNENQREPADLDQFLAEVQAGDFSKWTVEESTAPAPASVRAAMRRGVASGVICPPEIPAEMKPKRIGNVPGAN